MTLPGQTFELQRVAVAHADYTDIPRRVLVDIAAKSVPVVAAALQVLDAIDTDSEELYRGAMDILEEALESATGGVQGHA
jgi:hypothetical protein